MRQVEVIAATPPAVSEVIQARLRRNQSRKPVPNPRRILWANNLAAALEDADISQSELARHLGVNRAVVFEWLDSGRRPKPKHLQETARFLGKEPDQLWPDYHIRPTEEEDFMPRPQPAFKITQLDEDDSDDDLALLQINQVVPMELALKIRKMLRAAKNDKTDGDTSGE